MKSLKIAAVFFYVVLLLFAMANLFPKDNVPVMSQLQVESWKHKVSEAKSPARDRSEEKHSLKFFELLLD